MNEMEQFEKMLDDYRDACEQFVLDIRRSEFWRVMDTRNALIDAYKDLLDAVEQLETYTGGVMLP